MDLPRSVLLTTLGLLCAALAGCAETGPGGLKETAEREPSEEVNETEPFIPVDDRQPTSPYDPDNDGLNQETPEPDVDERASDTADTD